MNTCSLHRERDDAGVSSDVLKPCQSTVIEYLRQYKHRSLETQAIPDDLTTQHEAFLFVFNHHTI